MELLLQNSKFKPSQMPAAVSLIVAAAVVSGCNTSKTFAGLKPGETLTQGYVIDQQSLDLVPVGSSREQVLLALGSPSTTATFDRDETPPPSPSSWRPFGSGLPSAARLWFSSA